MEKAQKARLTGCVAPGWRIGQPTAESGAPRRRGRLNLVDRTDSSSPASVSSSDQARVPRPAGRRMARMTATACRGPRLPGGPGYPEGRRRHRSRPFPAKSWEEKKLERHRRTRYAPIGKPRRSCHRLRRKPTTAAKAGTRSGPASANPGSRAEKHQDDHGPGVYGFMAIPCAGSLA